MVGGLTLDLFDFQEEAAHKLIDLTSDSTSKQVIVMKSPTGSGKTIILIGFVNDYLDNVNPNTAIVWLCPGKGNLEDQSRQKMLKVAPSLKTQNLFDALTGGFEAGSTTFINWELVKKKDNNAIKEGERKNLFERIAEAHREGIEFLIIIDEEHSHNTKKADDIISAISAKHIIRVSATTVKNNRAEYFEIDEKDVIDQGLITKALYVNEGVEDNIEIVSDYDCLLELADKKRKDISQRYRDVLPDGKIIRPLVLVQFPNGQPETVEVVENKLADMGYTYDNGLVAKWLSDDKKGLTDDLTENNGTPVFLLMKQAISEGWDCPRAKILVKLREGTSEQFQIQTIGRIRRMPEAKHYDDDLLDFCYVYTFDETFKAGLLGEMDKAYEVKRLFLKDKCKTFSLEKQTRNLDFDGLGDRDVLQKIYEHLKEKYHLDKDYKNNKVKLEAEGYIFGNELKGKTLQGTFVETSKVAEANNFITTLQRVNTHKHGIHLLHSVDQIKSAVGMKSSKVKVILERMFRRMPKRYRKHKILSLPTDEFYAFIINNEHNLKEEFREVTSSMAKQDQLFIEPKTSTFTIPEQDFYKYDPGVKGEIDYLSNAYKEYTSGFATSLVRSTSEMLFEQYCEGRDDIDWVYKNGDTGQQYFSIVYLDGLRQQWLFYADYIVKKKNGDIWVIETKGGEFKVEDKNIDRQIANKFNAFKNYADKHNLNWGFVRDKDNRLYVNNTEFIKDMSNENWRSIDEVF